MVLIVADDMGWGDIGRYNEGRSRTPVLDELFAAGTVLTQQYSASPVCAPARAGLLTGRYPHRTGAIDTLETRGLDRLGLGERTIADHFTGLGYVTGLVGKWHNGAFDPRFHPTQRGFSEFAGFSGGWQDYWDWRLDRNGTVSPSDGRHLTDVLTDEAIAFVRRHRGRTPYFLHLAYNAPHYPLQAPAELVQSYIDAGVEEGPATIYAMVALMDGGIGRLLDEVDDDTVVVFTSDNGPQFGPSGGLNITRFNCGWSGMKGLVAEGGIRLPAVVRWPHGGLVVGECHDVVHFTDWLPTLLACAGVTEPLEGVDGIDRLVCLRGGASSADPVRFWQWNRYLPRVDSNAAMRDGNWKLVRPALFETLMITSEEHHWDEVAKTDPDAVAHLIDAEFPPPPDVTPLPLRLYDLDADPREEHDLAAEHPERVRSMEAQLIAWFESVEEDRRRAVTR